MVNTEVQHDYQRRHGRSATYIPARGAAMIARAFGTDGPTRIQDAGIVYLLVIATAEFLTTFVHPIIGVSGHALLLGVLLLHSARINSSEERGFLLSLTLAPLIRIVSLGMPIGSMDEQWQFLLTGLPLLFAALVTIRSLGLTRYDVRLRLPARRWWPAVIVVGTSGALLGVIEYESSIIRPAGIAPSLRLEDVIVPGLAILLTTGLTEELIFRGILQTTAVRLLGTRPGIIFVSALFALLHMGAGSSLGLAFAFVVGIYFAAIAHWSKSLMGPIVAHTIINILLFIVLPAW